MKILVGIVAALSCLGALGGLFLFFISQPNTVQHEQGLYLAVSGFMGAVLWFAILSIMDSTQRTEAMVRQSHLLLMESTKKTEAMVREIGLLMVNRKG